MAETAIGVLEGGEGFEDFCGLTLLEGAVETGLFEGTGMGIDEAFGSIEGILGRCRHQGIGFNRGGRLCRCG